MKEKTDPFYMTDKTILKKLGPDVTAFLTDLINMDRYWEERPERYRELEKRDYYGEFYHTRENIKENTCLSPHKQLRAQRILEDLNLIQTDLRWNPRKRLNITYYRINRDAIEEFKQIHEKEANPTSSNQDDQPLDVECLNVQAIENSAPMGQEFQSLNTEELGGNNNKSIKTKNKNVSNSTDVSVNQKFEQNCSEFKSITSRSRANARKRDSMDQPTDDEVDSIIQEYNRSMNMSWTPKDRSWVSSNLSVMQKLRPYLKPKILSYFWDNYSDDYTKQNVTVRRISAFIAHNLHKSMEQGASNYCQSIRAKAASRFSTFLHNPKYEAELNDRLELVGYRIEWQTTLRRYNEKTDSYESLSPKANQDMFADFYREHLDPYLVEKGWEEDRISEEVLSIWHLL